MNSAKLLLAGLGCALLLPSCSSKNDNPVITEQNLGTFYNVITDINSGETTVVKDVAYSVRRNFTDMTASVGVSGLKLPDNVSYPTFAIGPTKWEYDNVWMNIHATTVATAANAGLYPEISDLTFDTYIKYYNDYSGTTFTNISYKVNSRYLVHSYPTKMAVWGTTISSIEGTSYDYTTDESIYTIEINPDNQKADITITNFSVAVDNSLLSVSIKGLPFSFATNGDLTITADNATATITGASDPSQGAMPVEGLSLKVRQGISELGYSIKIDGRTYHVKCTDK